MNEDQAPEREAEEKHIAASLAAALFQEHAGWLRRYVRCLADNRSLPPSLLDPDDVVQEAFVQLLRHDWAEPIRNPGAWLCVVVRNQVSKAARQHRHFTDDDPAAYIEVGTAGWSSVPRQAGTEEVQAARAAVDTIARLPGNQQVATYLSRVQGWPQADIGAFLGCSTSAAGVHVFRGTHAVNAQMGGNTVTGSCAGCDIDQTVLSSHRSGYVAAVIQVVLAAVTLFLLASGVPWWAAVVPVIAPAGVILVIAAVVSLVWLCSVFTAWRDDHQRRRQRAQIGRHYGIPGRKAGRKP